MFSGKNRPAEMMPILDVFYHISHAIMRKCSIEVLDTWISFFSTFVLKKKKEKKRKSKLNSMLTERFDNMLSVHVIFQSAIY